ncbi:TonB-dependent receptor [Roseibium sp. RKSG952]|uniref:TonB-dependent receptor n=1 Tax=Roseibium sp. RKSG952 TaxID=2529384 RepID=UPI0012BBC6B3|nr:TonB-dependent receptor [Roseibium sp. RKSG952]MTH95634.1 TonB-dependent receptor [Roseibium sp. RKSG952]
MGQMLKYSGLVTAAVLAAVQGASAQDLTLEDQPVLTTEDATLLDLIVVKGATRTETPISEATVSVSVVTEEQIAEQTTINTNIGDIIAKTVPGFSQSVEGMSDYGQTLRGRNFLTLIDGVPQTSNLLNYGRSLNNISASTIGQIEVVRGATAAYGFGAPGGLVNIITKEPKDGEFNANMSLGVKASPSNLTESFSYITELGASGAKDGFFYLINGSFQETGSTYTADGERRPPNSFGTQGGKDDIMDYDVLAKVGYQHEAHKFQASVNRYQFWQDTDWGGVIYGGDSTTNTSAVAGKEQLYTQTPKSENTTVSTNYTNDDILGGTFDLQAYYNYTDTTFPQNWYYPGVDGALLSYLSSIGSSLSYFGLNESGLYPQVRTEIEKYGARATFDTPLTADALELDLVWGVDFIYEQTKEVEIDHPTYSPDYKQTGFAPFAQLNSRFFDDRLSITGGVRFEHLTVDISDFTAQSFTKVKLGDEEFPYGMLRDVTGGSVTFNEPLFNISGSFNINDTFTLYGGFSQGFQLGDLGRALSNDPTFTNVSQLENKGQTTDSYEIGLRAAGSAWDASITGFYNQSENGVTYDTDMNIRQSPEQIWGVEATANYQVTEQVVLGGTLTWMEGEFDSDSDGSYDSDLTADRITPWKLTAYAQYAPTDWVNLRLQGLYSGHRKYFDVYANNDIKIDSYFIVDAFADLQINEKSKLSLGVENITNTNYVPVLNQYYSNYLGDSQYYIKGPGTTFSAKYSLKF